MRYDLLPKDGQFYKANLHCHTNVSDGKLSPEEVKAIYKEKGYSIVAYTDHEALAPQNHLQDETFLPLNGTELGIDECGEGLTNQTARKFHLCCIALTPDNVYTPCYHSTKYIPERRRHYVQVAPGTADFEREYSATGINAMIAEAKRAGFFLTYNHPDWSLEDKDDYGVYVGMDAMEICNYGCLSAGFDDYNPEAYDALLRQGKRIYCVAADDNHNHRADSFGGWVMIKANALEYRTITRALQDGSFYASQGPEIHDLWLEDGVLHISCSPAEKIILTTSRRRRAIVLAEEGESVSCADFPVMDEDIYVRVTVVDHRGRPANTNAYFLDQFRMSENTSR